MLGKQAHGSLDRNRLLRHRINYALETQIYYHLFSAVPNKGEKVGLYCQVSLRLWYRSGRPGPFLDKHGSIITWSISTWWGHGKLLDAINTRPVVMKNLGDAGQLSQDWISIYIHGFLLSYITLIAYYKCNVTYYHPKTYTPLLN